MKKILLSTLFAIAGVLAAGAKNTETKIVSHRFNNESAASKLHVNSIYGNIAVTEADQSYIDIRVEIRATGRNEEEARKILDRINVVFSGKGTTCSAKTEIASVRGSRNESFEIKYVVTIPRGARLDVINKYGNLTTGNLGGTFTTDTQYGNVVTGELGGAGNTARVQYGNLRITNTPELSLSMSYGNFKAVNVAAMKANTKYSTLNVEYVGNLQISGSSYDNYTFEKVHTLTSSAGTSGIKIRTLVHSLNLPGVKYGQVHIDNVEPGFESIRISASYAGVKIGFTDPSFGYELSAKYGDVSLGDIPHQNRRDLRGYTDVTLEGHAGSQTKVKVKISTSYSSINLHRR